VQAIVCNYRDVTDRKSAEDASRRSAEYFRSLIENASDIIAVLEPTGAIRYMSPSIERVAGYRPDEVVSSTLFQLVHPDDVSTITTAISKAVQNLGTRQSAQFRVRHKNGEWRQLEGVGQALVDEAGAPYGVINLRDVTERVAAEEALSTERRVSDATINSLPGVFYLFDITGKFLLWNQNLADISGHSAAEISSMQPLDFIAAEDRELVAQRIQAVFLQGESTAEARFLTKDGSTIPYLFTGSRVIVEGTECVCGLGVDITDRKQYEEALHKSTESLKNLTGELEERVANRTAELKQINEELEAFAFSVSHDLRTQLRAMRGFGEAILEDYGNEMGQAAHDFTRRVVETTQQMDDLIQDILDYGRLTRTDVQLEPLALALVLPDALRQMSSEIDQRAADVDVESTSHIVVGHYQTLVQAVANLISNAIKFVANDTQPRVRIRTQHVGDWVRVSVEDNGIGVRREHRQRIFGMFERLHGVEDYPGTGIGLAIVRRAVERMGGRVGLRSRFGNGSCFWIELPSPARSSARRTSAKKGGYA
jgi:PAS domain S-box-containing protein